MGDALAPVVKLLEYLLLRPESAREEPPVARTIGPTKRKIGPVSSQTGPRRAVLMRPSVTRREMWDRFQPTAPTTKVDQLQALSPEENTNNSTPAWTKSGRDMARPGAPEPQVSWRERSMKPSGTNLPVFERTMKDGMVELATKLDTNSNDETDIDNSGNTKTDAAFKSVCVAPNGSLKKSFVDCSKLGETTCPTAAEMKQKCEAELARFRKDGESQN